MANAKEKKLQFYGVKQSKIQWMDLKIILIKDKNFKKFANGKSKSWPKKIWKKYIKIEKKFVK